MTTPPPDTKVQSETPHDGAAIINHWRGMNVKISRDLYQSPAAVAQLCEMIDSALRNERERCARAADTNAEYWQSAVFNYKLNDPMRASSASRAEMAQEIARAIREGR